MHYYVVGPSSVQISITLHCTTVGESHASPDETQYKQANIAFKHKSPGVGSTNIRDEEANSSSHSPKPSHRHDSYSSACAFILPFPEHSTCDVSKFPESPPIAFEKGQRNKGFTARTASANSKGSCSREAGLRTCLALDPLHAHGVK